MADELPRFIYTDPCFQEHQTSSRSTGEHPESPERLRFLAEYLAHKPVLAQFQPQEIRKATREELVRVHQGKHVDKIRDACLNMPGRIESDTVVSKESYDVALQAAGVAVAGVDALIAGKTKRAVGLVRPPGHHALPDGPMGFCLFNNIAVGAAHARDAHKLNRILVIDFDVHHGNGTQDMFYEDENVWFLSVHRSPFYPGTGAANETGRGKGLGTTFNLPLRFGVSRKDFLAQFENLLTTVAAKCRPELVLLSAGFDAHAADPVGSLGLETEDYQPLTRLVAETANQYAKGRLLSLLEGGYNVKMLAESIEIHLQTLAEV